MLEMRPNCECCNCDLPPNEAGAMICTFECTFCVQCAAENLDWHCPNCGGELVIRPIRPTQLLEKYPASLNRTFKPEGCSQAISIS